MLSFTICNFKSPLCRPFWIWTVPNSSLFPSPIPPCRLYRFVIHGNLTANIYLLSLCLLPFTFLIFCLFPSRVPQQVVYIYTYEWNAWRGEWFKDLKGGKSNEKSGFRFKHLWWALITSPLRKKSKLWRTWGNGKPQASHSFVSSEPPGLSGFHSYLGHGALSSQKSTTGGFLGGKLGWSSQAL